MLFMGEERVKNFYKNSDALEPVRDRAMVVYVLFLTLKYYMLSKAEFLMN